MKNSKRFLFNQFETEMWLYLDGTLDNARREFWEKRMEEFPELKNLLDEAVETLSLYDEYCSEELDERTYANTLSKTISRSYRRRIKNVLTLIPAIKIAGNDNLKIAFGAVISVAALILLLISNNPNPVKNVSESLLSWEDKEVSGDIENMYRSLNRIEFENSWEKAMMEIRKNDWEKNTSLIRDKLILINQQIKNKSL